MAREEIDPQLPFIMVHRGVGAKAAQLAPVLGVSYQHVRGAMEVFWESLAERRVLARALKLPTPAVILSGSEVRIRLHMAFGKEVDPDILVQAGFLEDLGDGLNFRVRGMSRYIATEAGRLKKRTGKPPENDPGGTGTPPGSDPGPTGVPPGSEAKKAGATGVGPGCHPAEVRGERREVIDETEHHPPDPPSETADGQPASGDDEYQPVEEVFWGVAQELRSEKGLASEVDRPSLFAEVVRAAIAEVGARPFRLAYERFLSDGDFEDAGWPMGVFIRPKVWRPRAHDRPKRDRLTGEALYRGGSS